MEHIISLISALHHPLSLAFVLAALLSVLLLKKSIAINATAGGAAAFTPARLPGARPSCIRGRGRSQGGFTLIELLICLAILCILAIIVGTVIYFTFFSGRVHISFT
jgi:prepilin-type N-terminal cleavage/methylation domain-containing protein